MINWQAMLHHVSLLNFSDSLSKDAIEQLAENIRELQHQIPEIAAYTVGTSAQVDEDAADIAIYAQFASVDDYRAYKDHPVHQRLIIEQIRPHLESRTATQFWTKHDENTSQT